MAREYRTISGDVWDSIAKKVYGDEFQVSFLMTNNQEYLDYFIFPEGIVLKIEDLPERKGYLPEWRL